MDKDIIKSSYVSLIGFILIIIIRVILTHKIYQFYNFNMRKIYALITYLLYLPLVGVILLCTTFIFYYYFKNKFRSSLLYLFLTIPSLIYLFIFILSLFNTFIIIK